MKLHLATVIEANDPAVQRAGFEELSLAYDHIKQCTNELDPGPPSGDPQGTAAWCAKAIDAFNRVLGARDLVEDSSKRAVKRNNASFAICIPTFGMVSIGFAQKLMGLAHPMSASSMMLTPVRLEIGVARNVCVEHVLNIKPRPEFIFFIDDDVLVPWDGLIRLFEQKLPIVAGMYYLKGSPSYPLLWREDGKMGYLRPGVDFKVGDLVEVLGTGCGCLLVRTEVFEKVSRPWFKTGPSKTEVVGMDQHTEDAFFFKKVAVETDYKVYVDTAVKCGHEDRTTGRIF